MQRLKVKNRTAKTVSEKLHEQFVPKPPRAAADNSDDDESGRPKFSEFDENDAELERAASAGLSDIRKGNIKYLDAIDRKYQGQVASRRDAFEDDDKVDSESDGEEDDSEEADYQPGAFVRLKPPQGSDSEDGSSGEIDDFNSADEDEEDDSDENDGNDFSLGDYLAQNSTDSQKLLQDENRQDSVQKGVCVQNQLKMWERLLEMRIKMQSCLISANSLPHEDYFKRFSKEESFRQVAERTTQTVESTLKNMLELQEMLADRFPETRSLLKSGSKRKFKDFNSNAKAKCSRVKEYESRILDNFSAFKPYQNDVLQKWHDRTKVSGNIKNAHQSQNIIKKIENSLLARDELVRKTQLYRGGYKLFEKPEPQPKEDHAESDGEPEPVYDTEIFDDSDFYHTLLRELIEYKSNTTSNPAEISAKLAELQKQRNKMKKQVDTRASKGRKIRYVVHKKLVNFTAPDNSHEWTEDAKNELFSSLFGGSSVSKE